MILSKTIQLRIEPDEFMPLYLLLEDIFLECYLDDVKPSTPYMRLLNRLRFHMGQHNMTDYFGA
jgi:hypothetical protein